MFPAGILSLATLGLTLASFGLWALWGLWPAPAGAQTYRWTDEQGGVHYSQGIYSVPERLRSKAQLLTYPDRPASPTAACSKTLSDASLRGTLGAGRA